MKTIKSNESSCISGNNKELLKVNKCVAAGIVECDKNSELKKEKWVKADACRM